MKTYYVPEPQYHARLRVMRNWFVAIVFAAVLCVGTADDINDAQVTADAAIEMQLAAQREAKINAKARAIAEQMIAEGEAQ